MKIKETYVSHTGLIDVGRFGLFINVARDGVYLEMDELVEQSKFFPRVILTGEPFEQKEDIVKYCKKLIKESPDIKIEINTNGTIRPIGIGSIGNIIYNIHLPLKISGVDYKRRIQPSIINWFIEVGANFIFNVNLEDEMDEANLIIQENNISKKDVYLTFLDSEQLDEVRKWAKYYGYNFAPNFKQFLWNNDGRK